MRNSSCRFAVVMLLLFPCFTLIAQTAAVELPMHPQMQHDPTRPYRAWVICIDTSLSPTEEQFRKSLAVMEEMAEKDVTYNDLVWVIQIQSTHRPPKLFQMPPANSRRSSGTAAADGLREAKLALISAIHQMSQVSGRTDLKNPLDDALDILRSHSQATARILVMGSDFLTDTSPGHVSFEPPKATREKSAAGVAALLLVTYPKLPYLLRLRISCSDLFTSIEAKWVTDLKNRGATTVKVRPVDSIPTDNRV